MSFLTVTFSLPEEESNCDWDIQQDETQTAENSDSKIGKAIGDSHKLGVTLSPLSL